MSLRQNAETCAKIAKEFSYQSECHCAKTVMLFVRVRIRLVTSQNVTAPKHCLSRTVYNSRLVTSQNVTAPKPAITAFNAAIGLVTSQNVTAPKPLSQNLPCKETSIPTGSEIISEQSSRSIACLFSFILS